jgi:predicted O-methyltransferase YrrM
MQYFEACLKKINEQTLFIFDDIYWSPEMKKAWDEITSRPEVKISIDLYDLGLIFFRNNQAKQHFVLKF